MLSVDVGRWGSTTYEIGAVGVHLSAIVLGIDVDLGLVDEADDLNVCSGFHELYALKSAGGDETGASSGFGAPSDHLAFSVCHGLVWRGGAP
jgi:hypothetical protein